MPIDVKTHEGIAHVVLSDPPLNILTRALLSDLRRALTELSADGTLRVLLLRAEGKHFSSGASVEEHLPGTVERMIPEFMQTIGAVRDFPVPTICAVQGRCLGGALELALAADLVIAADNASFGVPEISLGVIPPAACVQLPRMVPPGVAAELVFTGRPIDARSAVAVGLVTHVVEVDSLHDAAMRLAHAISAHSAAALRSAKEALRAGAEAVDRTMTEASRIYLEDLMRTTDAAEGLLSFMEKRQPHWTHS
ncbi:MAG: enoyl-CoA hydratase/isomerase family protein [Gemmatimonadota bacterium]